jgi:glycosyltransferase 2 family protein
VKIFASLTLALGFVWMLKRGGLPLLPPSESWKQVRWWLVAAHLGCQIGVVFLRTHRWFFLLRPVAAIPVKRVMGVGMMGIAAVLFAPLRMGELVRPWLISQRKEIGFSQAAGTIGAERVIDGMFLSVCLFLGLQASITLSPLPSKIGELPVPVAAIPAAAYAALAVFGTAFAMMALFYWRRALAIRVTRRMVGLVSVKLGEWVAAQVANVADGLRFLPSRDNSLRFLLETFSYWMLNAISFWVLLHATGISASLMQSWVVMGVLGVGILVPSGPGFFGAFQLSVFAALAMYFPPTVVVTQGAIFVFLLYSIQIVLIAVAGMLGLVLRGTVPIADSVPEAIVPTFENP